MAVIRFTLLPMRQLGACRQRWEWQAAKLVCLRFRTLQPLCGVKSGGDQGVFVVSGWRGAALGGDSTLQALVVFRSCFWRGWVKRTLFWVCVIISETHGNHFHAVAEAYCQAATACVLGFPAGVPRVHQNLKGASAQKVVRKPSGFLNRWKVLLFFPTEKQKACTCAPWPMSKFWVQFWVVGRAAGTAAPGLGIVQLLLPYALVEAGRRKETQLMLHWIISLWIYIELFVSETTGRQSSSWAIVFVATNTELNGAAAMEKPCPRGSLHLHASRQVFTLHCTKWLSLLGNCCTAIPPKHDSS